MGVLGEHFRSEGDGRESELARQRRWFIKAKHDHQRREDIAEKAEDAASAVASAASTIATPTQIRTFQSDLTTFDMSLIEALLEIDEKLDALKVEHQALLERAHVLNDGRRVFKSDDGTFVIDEAGQVVSPEDVDPDEIPDHLARSSTYLDITEEIEALKVEKQAIHEALDRNEAAKEWAEEPGRTVEELEAKRQELLDDLPASARAKLNTETAPSQDKEQVAQPAPFVKSDIPKAAASGAPTRLEM